MISDFFKGTTKVIYVSVSGSFDISGDEMWFYLRDEDELLLSQSADVASSGSAGTAIFTLTPTMTDISASCYDYEISWNRSNGDKHVVDYSSVNVKHRVSGSV